VNLGEAKDGRAMLVVEEEEEEGAEEPQPMQERFRLWNILGEL